MRASKLCTGVLTCTPTPTTCVQEVTKTNFFAEVRHTLHTYRSMYCIFTVLAIMIVRGRADSEPAACGMSCMHVTCRAVSRLVSSLHDNA